MATDSVPQAGSVERCLGWWKAFDLGARRAQLAEVAEGIVGRQEASREARVKLTDLYKTWRKQEDANKLENVMTLIREFQGNDDALQKRSKAAEVELVGIVKDLEEAIDPTPSLLAALEIARSNAQLQEQNAALQADVASLRGQLAVAVQASDKSTEVDRLKAEVSALETELSQLNNQDITIRQLEERLAELEAGVDTQVSETLAAKERELRAVFEAELEDVREAEAAAESRVSALQAALHDAQLARDEAQASLYTVRSRAEEDVASARADADTAAGEVERLSRQLALAQATAEEWKRKAAEAGAEGTAGLTSPAAVNRAGQLDALRSRAEAAEDEVSRLSSTVTALQEENRRWAALLDSQRAAHDKALSELTSSLSSKDGEIGSLKAEMLSRPTQATVAELRRQLALLQAVHFGGNAGAASDWDDESGNNAAGTGPAQTTDGSGDGSDIHAIMLRRIRQLESRAVRAESARTEAQADCDKLRADLAASQEALEEQRALVSQLDDLISGRLRGDGTGAAGASGTGTGAAVSTGQLPSTPGKAAGAVNEPQDALIAILSSPGPIAGSGNSGATVDEAASTSGAALATVLRGQRDKFRARALELEAEAQAKQAKLTEANERIAKLHGDNVRLYEKIRYLQTALASANREAGDTRISMSGGSGVRARGPGASAVPEDEPFESEYAKAYSDGLLEQIQMGGAGPAAGGVGTNSLTGGTVSSADPMAEFRRREKARTFQRLSTGEKLTVTGSRLFLANKVLRRAALIYAACLHLLVFSTLLHFANTKHGEAACLGPLGQGGHAAVDAALGRPSLGLQHGTPV